MAKEDSQLLVLKRIEKEKEQKAAMDLQSAQSFYNYMASFDDAGVTAV